MTFPLSRSAAEILDIVRRHPHISRSDVENFTLLSQQTIHRLVGELCDRELLKVEKPIIEGRGKPSPRLSINGNGAHAVGIAVNTGDVILATVDLSGRVLATDEVDVDPNDPEAVAEACFAVAEAQTTRLALNPELSAGTGVSMQGYHTATDGTFTTPMPIVDWTDLSAERIFKNHFGPLVFAENNATLAAIAEAWIGQGTSYPSFVYLSLNYGFGAGVIIEGHPVFGANRNAAEISSIFQLHEHDDRPALSGLLDDIQAAGGNITTLQGLSAIGREPVPGVEGWLDRVAPKLNLVCRAACALLDPDAIVLGGEAPPALVELLIERCEPRRPDRYDRPMPGPVFLPTKLAEEPSLVGAAVNAFRRRILGKQT